MKNKDDKVFDPNQQLPQGNDPPPTPEKVLEDFFEEYGIKKSKIAEELGMLPSTFNHKLNHLKPKSRFKYPELKIIREFINNMVKDSPKAINTIDLMIANSKLIK